MEEENEKEDLKVDNSRNELPVNNYKLVTGSISGLNTNALKLATGALSGLNTNALKSATGSISGLNTNALKSATGSISGLNTNALKLATGALSGFNTSALKPATSSISGLNTNALRSATGATGALSGVNTSALKSATGALSGVNTSALKSATGSISGLNTSALKLTTSAFSSVSSNWVLSDSVVNEMSLVNNETDAKYIFSKIPKDDYQILQSFDDDSEKLEFVLENKENTESIPVRGIPKVLAVTDIVTSLSTKDVFNLYRHLVEFPMLGLEHPVGRRIFDEINMNLIIVENLNLFRVRSRDIKIRKLPFTDKEMFKAPHGVSGQGRYNFGGHGELYTCNVKEVALNEIVSDDPNLRYDIIEWKLTEPVKLLDLSDSGSPLVQYCSFEKSTQNGQEYLLPNFLAQCAKYHGVYGIIYESVVNPAALNYVFFDYQERWFNTVDMEFDKTYNQNSLATMK
ncbi:RES domain-containing protein [Bacillus altitudinis]|uniref:RES domain-containing protein n=1 Tax=Bacillus altitudinis TaxID=293387 RepID=UPI002E2211D5|nr:RES domain-containing protein [Bacillus altitudinis]